MMAFRRGVTSMLLGAFYGVSACASSDPAVDVPQRCNESARIFCEANVKCSLEVGEIVERERAEFTASCASARQEDVGCARMTKIVGIPAVCDRDFLAVPCSKYLGSGLPIPTSCEQVYAP